MNIEPIKLLNGSHEDVGVTGRGCFMNVIAYLNGDAQITDASPCVCVVVCPIAIWINDFMRDDERQQLLPYIMRATGSATTDKTELVRRAWLAVALANEMAVIAYAAPNAAYASNASNAATYAAYAAYTAANAPNAANAATNAADAAGYAVDAANAATHVAHARRKIIAAGMLFFDAALARENEARAPIVEERAAQLLVLAAASA